MSITIKAINSETETVTLWDDQWSSDTEFELDWNEALRLAQLLVCAVAELSDRTKVNYFVDYIVYQLKP